ncbi:transposase [Flavobacterium jumunjinense]|nr:MULTISPECIES: transposase [Flavobacterium]
MAKIVFKNQSGNSPELFPINIFNRIPQNHPVCLVEQVVNQLDISEILKKYKGGGTSAYHPRMMIKVLFYSYLSNVYSCRKIAKALQENIHFMYISGNSTPDFRTINDFRGKILKNHIQTLFAEVVKMLVEMKYVSLDIQYIDGTKIESKANKYTFVWRGSVEKYKEKLEHKINYILSDIENSIQSDNQELNTEELPKSIDSESLNKSFLFLIKNSKNLPKSSQKNCKSYKKNIFQSLKNMKKT